MAYWSTQWPFNEKTVNKYLLLPPRWRMCVNCLHDYGNKGVLPRKMVRLTNVLLCVMMTTQNGETDIKRGVNIPSCGIIWVLFSITKGTMLLYMLVFLLLESSLFKATACGLQHQWKLSKGKRWRERGGGGVEERKREGRVKPVTSERQSSPLTFSLFSHLNNPFHLSVVMHGEGQWTSPPSLS